MTLYNMHLTFSQEGNTLGSTEPTETMEVAMELVDAEDAPFAVLKSPTGWSIDDVGDLVALLDRCYAAWRAASDKPVKEQ